MEKSPLIIRDNRMRELNKDYDQRIDELNKAHDAMVSGLRKTLDLRSELYRRGVDAAHAWHKLEADQLKTEHGAAHSELEAWYQGELAKQNK